MTNETIADGARLAALRDLGILDTEPEEDFDRFTHWPPSCSACRSHLFR